MNDEEFNAILVRIRINDPTLKIVDFSENPNPIGDQGALNLANALKGNATLKELNLSGNQIGDDGVKSLVAVLKTIKTLTRVDLNANRIKNEGFKDLANLLKDNKTLTRVDLGGNEAQIDGFRALLGELRDNSTLTELSLSHSKIGVELAKILANALEGNTALEKLDLSFNNIKNKGVEALANALNNSALKELYLASNNIKNAGVEALFGELKGNKTLKKLDLSLNKIRDQGVIALGDLLKDSSMTKVNLSSNKIKSEGVIAFAKALEGNTALEKLYLIGNKIGYKGAEALEKVFEFKENPTEKYNLTLRDLKISNNQIGKRREVQLNKFMLRNAEIPNNIVEKIYESFMQKKQGQGQDQIASTNPVLLLEMESRLIATSPNSCVEILKQFFKKDGISEILSENPKILVDHVRQFPSGLGLSGLKILLASAQLKEPKNFFKIENFSPNDIFLLMGASKKSSSPEMQTNLAKMPPEILTKIFEELKNPSKSPKPTQITQTQQPLNLAQNLS
jgi:Ran GTPase-activating protein (RanGAP) involved in mRNA processing and transport